jgi:hypothetical protein
MLHFTPSQPPEFEGGAIREYVSNSNPIGMTKKRGFKLPFLKGIIKKMSDFKLRPFKAEPIQNPKSFD